MACVDSLFRLHEYFWRLPSAVNAFSSVSACFQAVGESVWRVLGFPSVVRIFGILWRLLLRNVGEFLRQGRRGKSRLICERSVTTKVVRIPLISFH